MSRRGKTVGLGGALRDTVRRLGGNDRVHEADVARTWTHVVGGETARHTHILGVRKGELLVGVDSPVWATELSAMSERLRKALNLEIGQETVGSIRFSVSRSVSQEREREDTEDRAAHGWATKVQPVPLSPEERARLEATFSDVADEHLREVAVRAAVKDLEWKKGGGGLQ